MSQFPHDEFTKEYIPELITEYGITIERKKIKSQVKEVDIFFEPRKSLATNQDSLGWLVKLIQTACLFEVYRNPVTVDEINECISKLIKVKTAQKEAKRKNKSNQFSENQEIKLWILTPILSPNILNLFSAKQTKKEFVGIYQLPPALNTEIIVIHQLPRIADTLWLRLLGKSKAQENAIDELSQLPLNYPHRENVLELVSNLYTMLETKKQEKQKLTPEDEELIMKLSPIYEQKLAQSRNEGIEQGIQQGIQEGIQQNIISQLERKLRDLPTNLETKIISLSLSQLQELGFALLDFNSLNDLTDWLNQNDE